VSHFKNYGCKKDIDEILLLGDYILDFLPYNKTKILNLFENLD